MTRTDNKVNDICDESYFKQHPLFSGNHLSLQLIIYYNELKVCIPLGHGCGMHKLGINEIIYSVIQHNTKSEAIF